eukprot:259623_1
MSGNPSMKYAAVAAVSAAIGLTTWLLHVRKRNEREDKEQNALRHVKFGTFRGCSILSVAQFDRDDLDYIFHVASYMRRLRHRESGNTRPQGRSGKSMQPTVKLCDGLVLAMLFFEPSTRTATSFEAAMYRLGGQVVAITDVKSSSVSKGETLEDTIRTLQSYSDAIVLRHPEIGSASRADQVATVPVLNAGDGAGEHPTQALLDVFTMYSEMDNIDGLTIAMVGDLKHGRTVHSLTRLLCHFNVRLQFVSTDELALPDSILNSLTIPYEKYDTIQEVIGSCDVLYMTRVQKERFKDPELYETVKDAMCLTKELMRSAKQKMIVMHPLPRVNEINTHVDSDPRAAYFRQMENGLYIRMALLAMCLGKA